MKELSRYLPYMRGQIEQGKVEVCFIPGNSQPADFVTKAILGPQLDRCRSDVGMRQLNVTTGHPLLTNSLATRTQLVIPSSSDDSATPHQSSDEEWQSVMSKVSNLG